jgi:hypothetical protein
VTGGTLRHDARCYVERRADRELFEGLMRAEFCYVLTSRQMGKSSLMARTAVRLRQAGVNVATLDLTSLGQNLTSEQWYGGLLDQIAAQTDCEEEMEQYWAEHARLGPLQRWLGALREVGLRLPSRRRSGSEPAGAEGPPLAAAASTAPAPTRLIIFVDEIDTVRSLPFAADEFFGAIRECYNRRAAEPEYHRLSFCLLGVATPGELIRDPHTTPFNIGRRIELTDFTEDEGAGLAQGLGREEKVARVLLRRIFYWTGGHPYLTQVLCHAVANDPTSAGPAGVDRLCDKLFLSTRARERDDNLVFVRQWLTRSKGDLDGLLSLYARIWAGEQVMDDPGDLQFDTLRLAGIVRPVDRRLQVRNRIYHRVFDREWLASSHPKALERQHQAAKRIQLMRRTVLTSVALVLLALVVGISFVVRRLTAPPRASTPPVPVVQLPSVQLDLSSYFTGSLTSAWSEGSGTNLLGQWLPELPDRAKPMFRVDGVVQLSGQAGQDAQFGSAARAIKVGRRCERLHLLHAVQRTAPGGTQVASLVVNYTNRYRLEIPIFYGQEVCDWRRQPGNLGQVAGIILAAASASAGRESGTNATGFLGAQFCQSTFANPLPNVPITSLDYVSTQAGPAPFLLAITVE